MSEFWEEEIEVNVAPVVRTAAACAVLLSLASCYGNDDENLPPPPVLTQPNSVAIADVNGDGVPDLLLATTIDQGGFLNPGEANVILGKSSPKGSFATAVSYPTTGPNPSSIAVANLGAGGLDLVVANYGSGSVTVFMHGATAGTFQTGVDVSTGGSPNQVAVAPLNGGNPDIVVADASTSGNVIILWHGAVAGTYQAPVLLPAGVTVSGVSIADIDGDGLPDIVAATYDANGNNGAVYVFYQGPAGQFTSAPVKYPAGAQPQTVRVADLRGIGARDLVVANLGPGTDGTGSAGVSVLLQTGAPSARTFAAPVTYATGGGTVDVQAAPLTGSLPDIVTANLGPAPTGSISVLLHVGDGTFKPATNYPGAAQPLAVAIGDLNGDGRPDIAVADSPTALVLMQTSGGMFAAPVQVGQ